MSKNKIIRVESCDSCSKAHVLTVGYEGGYILTVGLPPPPLTLTVSYVCSRTKQSTTADIEFDGPVTDVEVVAVANA